MPLMLPMPPMPPVIGGILATVALTPFQLSGSDGGPLRGEVRTAAGGRGRPAVVICHGFKGFRNWGFFPHLAERIARAGFTAVTFNFSGSGVGPDGETFSEPDRFARATFSADLTDLDLVCRALEAGKLGEAIAPPTAIGLFGHSRGGGTAILYTATHTSCGALVTWAAIADTLRWDEATVARWRKEGKIEIVNMRTGEVLPLYLNTLHDVDAHRDGRLNIVQAAAAVAVPWLLVHGAADAVVAPSDADRLSRAAQGDSVELRLIPEGAHTFGARHPWAGSTPELDQAMDETVGWFSRYLL